MGVRRQARETALQVLYACDFLSDWTMDSVRFSFDHFSVQPPIREYAEQLCQGVIVNRQAIDSRITCASDNWSMSRMSRVDRTILRIGASELLFIAEVPVSVAINEAIEIAKRFGTDESPNFVNGVLDRLANSGGDGGESGNDEPSPVRAAS